MQDQRMAVPSAFYSSCQSIYRNQWCPAPSKKNLRLQNQKNLPDSIGFILSSFDLFGKNNKNCGFPYRFPTKTVDSLDFPLVSLMDFPGCSYPGGEPRRSVGHPVATPATATLLEVTGETAGTDVTT
jgi:hypothetical protein